MLFRTTPEPDKTPEPSTSTGRKDSYDGKELDDLMHVIDDLEDAKSWGRVREMIWISIIIHLLIAWYLIYGPKYIWHVHVVTPAEQLEEHPPKQLSYIQLPPDLLKQLKPKNTNVISDQNRRAETEHPVKVNKTLQQLEAMRRAGELHTPGQHAEHPSEHPSPRPAERPAPTEQAERPTRQGSQQHAQQAPAPKAPPSQPLPSNTQAKVEAPAPTPHIQNFRNTNSFTPGEQLQQAMRAASRGAYYGGGGQNSGNNGGDNGMNAPIQHNGMQGAVEVLSDTMGVDFSHYLQEVIAATRRAWYPLIPDEARPPLNKQGEVAIRFEIFPDGSVHVMQLYGPSGDVALDRAAWGGITGASPYPPLPKQFHGKYLALQFNFLYNEGQGGQ